MPSTPWHPARLARATLLLGAVALALVVPVSAAHLACDHADHATPDQHQCLVCRHLDDVTPLLTAAPAFMAPTPVVDLLAVPVLAMASLATPPACGRSPPAHVSVP